MKPITDCEYNQDDGCCGHPDAPTPECHVDACPRPVMSDHIQVALMIPRFASDEKRARLMAEAVTKRLWIDGCNAARWYCPECEEYRGDGHAEECSIAGTLPGE